MRPEHGSLLNAKKAIFRTVSQKSSRYGLRIPGNEAHLRYAAMTRDTRKPTLIPPGGSDSTRGQPSLAVRPMVIMPVMSPYRPVPGQRLAPRPSDDIRQMLAACRKRNIEAVEGRQSIQFNHRFGSSANPLALEGMVEMEAEGTGWFERGAGCIGFR